MKTICEEGPYMGFKKLLSFLTAFALGDPFVRIQGTETTF